MNRRHVYGGVIVLSGLVLTLVQVVQGVQQLDNFTGQTRTLVFAFETVPFVLIGLTLSFLGYWLIVGPTYEADLPRIGAWGLGGALLFASVGALLLFSQQVDPALDVLDQAPYVAVNQITVGAVVGVLVGLYDARSRAHLRDLQTERDRTELFAKKAMDINTYGRELNRRDTVDGVSALCIQAIQGFLDLSETAFVVVDDIETKVVDSTVVDAPDESLIELAQQARDQDSSTVVAHETLPEGLKQRAEGAVTVLVTDHGDTSVVLLALTDDPTGFDEEDVQLLELLLAHAGTALDHIYHEQTTAK